MKINNPFIKLKENLDKNDYSDINELKNICMEYDKTFLKLEIDFKMNNAGKISKNMKHINEFMFYNENILIGYVGICCFGGVELEVNGMVHPEYRRKGIFTRLFSLVRDEFNKRDSKLMLLLSDNSSVGGIEFIKNITDDYEHSEYDMSLDMDMEQTFNDNMVFKKASYEDIEKIVMEDFEFNNHYKDTFGNENDAENLINSTYVMEKDNAIIGMVRLEVIENAGGIYGLEVLSVYRGKGYGRELLNHSIKKLKEDNVESISLQVVTDNKNALNLYKSCGFKENYIMDYYRLVK
jgi:ribosomal protein S18 acetylase RimI-like enzyme